MPMPWPRALDALRTPVRAGDDDAPPALIEVAWCAPDGAPAPAVDVAFWLGDVGSDTAGPP